MESETPRLRECAHCANHAHIRTTPVTPGSELLLYWAECVICEIGTKYHDSESGAAAIWNTRSFPATLPTGTNKEIADDIVSGIIPSYHSNPTLKMREQIESALDDKDRERVGSVGVEEARRPKIICLCGSTRFIETFAIKTWELEREGYIVLGCTLLPMWYCQTPSHFGEATGTKEQCDELHKRKIDLADEVLVLNIGGYIGESTLSEIEYAAKTGKPVNYLEALAAALAGNETEEKG